MSGFRQPEQPREQIVLWSQRLVDAIPDGHPVRLFDELMRSSAFAETFSHWAKEYVLVEGKPPFHRVFDLWFVQQVFLRVSSHSRQSAYDLGAVNDFVYQLDKSQKYPVERIHDPSIVHYDGTESIVMSRRIDAIVDDLLEKRPVYPGLFKRSDGSPLFE